MIKLNQYSVVTYDHIGTKCIFHNLVSLPKIHFEASLCHCRFDREEWWGEKEAYDMQRRSPAGIKPDNAAIWSHLNHKPTRRSHMSRFFDFHRVNLVLYYHISCCFVFFSPTVAKLVLEVGCFVSLPIKYIKWLSVNYEKNHISTLKKKKKKKLYFNLQIIFTLCRFKALNHWNHWNHWNHRWYLSCYCCCQTHCTVALIYHFLRVLISLSVQNLMGAIKPGSKVMSALYNHSWCYSQEGCFDVAQIFGRSLLDLLSDRADRRNT